MRQFLHTTLEYWFKTLNSCPVREKERRGDRKRCRGQEKEEIRREIKRGLREVDKKDKTGESHLINKQATSKL